jgi:hypothetical protein
MTDRDEADNIVGSVGRTLTLVQQGVLALPDEADLVTFVLSGARLKDRPKAPPIRTLSELKGCDCKAEIPPAPRSCA